NAEQEPSSCGRRACVPFIRADLWLAPCVPLESFFARRLGVVCKQKAESPRSRLREPGLPTAEINAGRAGLAPTRKNSSAIGEMSTARATGALTKPPRRSAGRKPRG